MTRVRKLPQRMCVGCREMKNKRDLIRVVRTPDGQVLVDRTGKKSGRGAYVCPSVECLSLAVKGKRLQKALEQEIPAEVLEQLRKELEGH
ncbi:MAG: YlxR family protein [Syntrophomonadaceae bacterium]|nr:YlxR family protein [Syntrophomonadaceae bacterium]MDH7498301.1 YlxR family protein [Syntrophomonadaceae bacterium]